MRRLLLTVSAVALLAFTAQANAGTPLMWAAGLHLCFGNLVIGIVEGVFLARVYHLSTRRCIGLLILSNYLSAWLGVVALSWSLDAAPPVDLENFWTFAVLTVLGTFAVTLVVEHPFVAFAFPKGERRRRRVFLGSLMVQATSYFFLFSVYATASPASLITRAELVDISELSVPQGVEVFFISSRDGDVYSGAIGGTSWQRVFDLNSTHGNDRLLVRRGFASAHSWDLFAYLESKGRNDSDLTPVLVDFALEAAPQQGDEAPEGSDALDSRIDGNSSIFGPAARIGSARTSHWEFSTGSWAAEGLRGTNAKTGARLWRSLETPFAEWYARNATHLPGDLVLLQLGKEQVCLYDPNADQIALIARGRGPVAAICAVEAHPGDGGR